MINKHRDDWEQPEVLARQAFRVKHGLEREDEESATGQLRYRACNYAIAHGIPLPKTLDECLLLCREIEPRGFPLRAPLRQGRGK